MRKVRIVSKSPVFMYGMRPVDEPGAPELAYLSLYEFMRYWRVELAAFPRSERELSEAASDAYQATLTETGLRKVREAAREKKEGPEGGPLSAAQLKAGVDYEIKEGGRDAWVPFPDAPGIHARALARNERPRNSSFHGAPQAKHGVGEEDRNGLLLMAYFRAFTLRDDIDCGVPHLRDFRGARGSWAEASLERLRGGLPCEDTKRHVQNYIGVWTCDP